METKFFRCPHCGNVIVKVVESGVPVVCCGEPMKELIPNTEEASMEKHLPYVACCDEHTVKVNVGRTDHPMLPEHYIQLICLETETGFQITYLKPESHPHAVFSVRSKPKNIYAYCNVHGLWKTPVKECPLK